MAKTINIRPTTGVYATYKNIKYDAWTAIAEFVDNSTQSYYDHERELKALKDWKSLDIYITYQKDDQGNPFIEIKDNAYGMNFKDFQRAIILDSKPEKSTRSEFGMGLKTAACWFGLNWSVETVELNSCKKYKTSVDVEKLSRTKDEEITYEEIECDKSEHGTTIRIWNLNRKLFGRQIQNTKDKLRGMYRVDLRTEKIKIFYNGGTGIELLRYEMPSIYKEKLPGGNEKEWSDKVEFEIEGEDSKKYHAYGFIGILETGSTYGAGFTLIRRGRVIIGGYEDCYRPREIFGASTTGVYQRFFGELNLDEFPVTQTKDSFDWYNGLEDKFIDKLKEIAQKYIDEIKRITNPKQYKKPLNVGIDNATINEFAYAGLIQNAIVKPIEKEDEKTESVIQIPSKDESDSCLLFPQMEEIRVEGNDNTQISFEISSRKYILNFTIKKNNSDEKWLVVSPKKNNNSAIEVDVEWNIVHPFFTSCFVTQENFDSMKKFVFALVLSEIESTYTSSESLKSDSPADVDYTKIKISPFDIREKMNETLKAVIRS
nr:ATP-binding protein [uncultured Treponema sp.]